MLVGGLAYCWVRSITDTPHAENDPTVAEEARDELNSGVRAAIGRAAAFARSGAHPTLTALFCAGAAAPILVAAAPTAAVPAAVLAILGGLGRNALHNVIENAIGRLKSKPEADPVAWLATQLDAKTAAGDADAEAIRRDMASLLAETEAIPAAFEAIVEAEREDLLAQLLVRSGPSNRSRSSRRRCRTST